MRVIRPGSRKPIFHPDQENISGDTYRPEPNVSFVLLFYHSISPMDSVGGCRGPQTADNSGNAGTHVHDETQFVGIHA
jgi:hypothetical protein